MTIHVNKMQLQKIAKAIPLMACTQIAKEMNISVRKIRSIKSKIVVPEKSAEELVLFEKWKPFLKLDRIPQDKVNEYLTDINALKK